VAGPVEAAVIGNVLVQAVTSGRFASLAAARGHVAERVQLRRFAPKPAAAWTERARRYRELEARFLEG
jgi:rhamnulokinase